jgi:arylsulfatase A-like enzyme
MLMVAATAVSVCALSGCDAAGDRRPAPLNLLLITLDTLRADHLGCYGYDLDTSPVIDDLARRSSVFTMAIAQSAVTPVSHATIAELLRSRGFETAAFVSAFTVTRHYGLDQGFETWDQDFKSNDGEGLLTEDGIVNTGDAQRRADVTTDRALRWLRRQVGGRFFLWIHYFDVHDPVLLPPREFTDAFQPASSDTPSVLRAVYDAEIAFVDSQVGRVMAALEEIGAASDTVVVIVADHGEGLGDHGWWGHTILYQEQIRVPMIVSAPEIAPRRVSTPVRTIDVVPTVAELLELSGTEDADWDGTSLVEAMRAGGIDARSAVAESINDLSAYPGTPYTEQSLYALLDWPWKLILHVGRDGSRGAELFNLESDPTELRNLAGESGARLNELMSRVESGGSVVESPPEPTMDDATRERLRALGYVR